MTGHRLFAAGILTLLGLVFVLRAQTPDGQASPYKSDLELVEKLLVARRDYQTTLEQLRAHYLATGDAERAKWAEDELVHYHRIPKYAYRIDLVVPPPTLHGTTNVPAANKLYMRAMSFKDKGWGTDYIDNQRRAEILFQQILTQYPQSDRISDTAYMLGDIYESKANKQYRLAAVYFERCFQWNPSTQLDARIRAARLYDRQLLDRGKAIEIYKEATTHEIDPRRVQEAQSRLNELVGTNGKTR
jgi:tetratricopeptide (TPR) repeat protein